jgi:spore maturation protein CgeB
LRALVVHPGPEYSVADVHRGWLKGLAAVGVDVREYNLHDRLNVFGSVHVKTVEGEFVPAFEPDAAVQLAAGGIKQACYDWWPDLVVIISGFYTHRLLVEVMRDRGHKVVTVFTESPYEDDRQLQQAEAFDAVILNDPTNIERFQEATTALYLPHCYDPQIHHPGRSDHKSDVCFVGTGFPSRVDYLSRVNWDGIDLALAGNWAEASDDLLPYVVHDLDDCLPNEQTADVYRGATASFNLYRTEAQRPELSEGWAMGPREVELAACGTWFARQSRPEGDDLFPMLPIFDSPEELEDQLRWALTHETERQEAASRARAAVVDRTFDANARRLLQALGF